MTKRLRKGKWVFIGLVFESAELFGFERKNLLDSDWSNFFFFGNDVSLSLFLLFRFVVLDERV
jgi:hypothetical protein